MTPKHRSVLRRKSNGKVFKKRRFYGNRNQNELDPDGEDTDNPATPPSTSADLTSTFTSTSSKKLKLLKNASSSNETTRHPPTQPLLPGGDGTSDTPTSSSTMSKNNPPESDLPATSCYIVIDSEILQTIISLIGTCPLCNNKSVDVSCDDLSKKMGLAVPLNLSCTVPTCSWSKEFFTSKSFINNKPGNNPYEINYRSVLAMREIGKGHTSLATFCGYMNMPPPLSRKAFNDIQGNLHGAGMF